MKEQGKETLIEQGTTFRGSFASDCPIVVRGRIEGEISAPSLVVSKTGAVAGKVKVKEMRSEGELSGEYDADSIYLSGAVKDKTVLRARSLEVRLTPERGRMQLVFGECEIDVGDLPTKEESIAQARSAFEQPAAEPPALWDDIPAASPFAPAQDEDKDNSSKKRTNKRSSVPPPAE